MELEKLVLAELESIDLKGAKILNLSCATDETEVSFEISDTIIDFTVKNEDEFIVTSLTRNEQVYTDEEILSKCDGWVGYVGKMITPIVKKHRDEIENFVSIEDDIKETEIEENSIVDTVSRVIDENNENKIEVIDDMKDETFEEAEARGHKEGYKIARKKNAVDIRKLKKKYHFIIFCIIIVLLGAFAAVWILYGPGFVFLNY